MKRKFLAVAFGLAAFSLAPAAGAQITVAASATLTIPAVLYLNVTNTAVTFGTPVAADYNAGYIAAVAPSVVSHGGNVRHDVRIWTTATNMTASGGGAAPDAPNATKSVNDLKWSDDAFVTTHALQTAADETAATGADALLVNQAARGQYANDKSVTFRMALSYANDTPGTYDVAFNYTVIAN